MTPDTPTTATAAMSELLAKHPIPWAATQYPYQGRVLTHLQDANGNPINRFDGDTLSFIVAAVNATGTGEKSLVNSVPASSVYLELMDERDELRSALAAARERISSLEDSVTAAHRAFDDMQSMNSEVRSQLAAAREQHGAAVEALKRIVKLEHTIPGKLIEHPADIARAALSPSQPTPDAGEKQCDPSKLCDPEWIGSELDPHEQRCRKCGVLRAAGGGGER